MHVLEAILKHSTLHHWVCIVWGLRTKEFLVVCKNVHPIALSLRQTQSTVVVLKEDYIPEE